MKPAPDAQIPEAFLQQAAQTLRALTHPQRLRICELLLLRDCAVGDLARTLGLRPNVVSQHLTHLRAYGIVAPQRAGRSVHYRVVHPGAGWLLACIRRALAEPTARNGVTPVDGQSKPVRN